MSDVDPSNLMRGLWSSLASFPSLIISSSNRVGCNSCSNWQSWLAREQELLGVEDGFRGSYRSPTSHSGDLTLSDLSAFSPVQTAPGSWLDSILGLLAWNCYRLASQQYSEQMESSRDVALTAEAGESPTSGKPAESQGLVPCQFDSSLSAREAYAACGPAAAVAFARAIGKNPSVREVLDLAKTVGWTPEGGMNGVVNQKRLLDKLGIQAKLDTSIDWDRIAGIASSGTPVTISTPGHYFVADAYDPQTERFHVGASGTAYRGGKEWMTRQEIEELAGALNGALTISQNREWSV